MRGGEDKFVFSVVWEVDEDMQVLDVRFHRSIVHSRAALSYGEAQAMLDDPAVDTEVARGVRILNKLARVLRRKRMEAGALTLASPEVRACARCWKGNGQWVFLLHVFAHPRGSCAWQQPC